MSIKKQTAVEWLMEQILPTISIRLSDTYIKELTNQAKEMEKEHMKSTYIAGRSLGRFADPEDYYTSTYGQ
jgi:hypothetical protein